MEPNLLFLTSLSSVLSIGLMGPLKESAKAEGFPRSCRANRVGYDAVVIYVDTVDLCGGGPLHIGRGDSVSSSMR